MLWYFRDRHQPPPILSTGHLQTFYFGVTPPPPCHHTLLSPGPPPLNPPHSQQYHPPNTFSLKVYCNGSFQDGPHQAAYGVVIMNTEGIVCDGRASLFMCSSPTVSEAKAFLEAMTFACNSQCSCTIFSDCLTLVNSVKAQKHRWPWECYGLIGRITDIFGSSPNISIRFLPRKENIFADWVAHNTRLKRLPPEWLNLIMHTHSPQRGICSSVLC
ncbi:hypothetical protein LINPERHAP1_LOCUS22713 [Linum perenne]